MFCMYYVSLPGGEIYCMPFRTAREVWGDPNGIREMR